MARRSSVLHTMMKSFLAISIGAVAWILIGYTVVFGPEGNAFFGSMKFIGLSGMTPDLLEPTGIPTLIFVFLVLCQLGGSKSNSKHYEIRN
jgi:Amt family ammonium transporter